MFLLPLSRATHPRSLSVRIQFVGALFLLTYLASPSDLDYCLALFNPSMEVSSLAALGIRSPNFYVLIGAGDSIPIFYALGIPVLDTSLCNLRYPCLSTPSLLDQ